MDKILGIIGGSPGGSSVTEGRTSFIVGVEALSVKYVAMRSLPSGVCGL
jgi:hypothetical protein